MKYDRHEEVTAEQLSAKPVSDVLALSTLPCSSCPAKCELPMKKASFAELVSVAFGAIYGEPDASLGGSGHYIARASADYGELWVAEPDGYEVGAYSLNSLLNECCAAGVVE